MTTPTEKILTGLTLVRDAGSAVADAAVHSNIGTSLVKAVPKAKKFGNAVKEMVSVGAGLAIAKRGGKVALAVARKNPIATIAGAAALAGLGVAVAVVRKRKRAREDAEANGTAAPKPKRIAARNMRGNAAAAAKKAPAKKAAPRARKPVGTSTH